MGILDGLFKSDDGSSGLAPDSRGYAVDSNEDEIHGELTKDGNMDHRYHQGGDRTPAQKAGDEKRRKDNDDD